MEEQGYTIYYMGGYTVGILEGAGGPRERDINSLLHQYTSLAGVEVKTDPSLSVETCGNTTLWYSTTLYPVLHKIY